MNRRPGQVRVTSEVAYCSFCGRPRTLRREEHQLGTLVRTIVTCETCHRTLSSTMGVAQVAEPADKVPEPVAPVVEEAPVEEAAPRPKRTPAKRTAAATAKSAVAAKAKPATKKKTPPKK